MASVDGAVGVYRYSYPPYYPYYGLGGVMPVTGVEAKKVEGKMEDVTPISSYLIDPLYASYYHGYPYVGYPYGPALRFIRDADKKIEEVGAKVEEPKI